MDWQAIMSNPRFVDQYGMYVTGDPEQFWNSLPEEQKIFLNNEFGSGPAPEPVLTQNQTVANPNDGFERVMVGGGISSASVLYNPATGEVRAVEGDPTSQMISRGANIQAMAKDAYNKGVARPVYEAQKDVETMENIVNAQEGDVDGAILNQYTAAKERLSNAQRAALSQVSDPSTPDMVMNNPAPYTTPVLTGLEQMEQPFIPNVLPVETQATGINTQITPNVVNKPNVPNVDFADPTMVPPVQGPVLIDTTQPNNEATAGVLGGTTAAAVREGPSVRSIMSSSGPKTSNMRGSAMPSMLVDRNEALIRIGGAMYGGALKGDGISAATREYGAIQDANRKTAMEKYKADQAQKLAMARAAAKGKKTSDKDSKMMSQVGDAMFNYQKALSAIRESRAEGGNLTGLGGMAKALVDNFTGDEDAARRLILQRVKVDDALLRVAETKGAISNAEMKLFLAPAPKNWQDEAIWEQWILDRMNALQNIQNRLTTGQQVPMGDRPTNAVMGGNTSESDDGQYTVELIQE